MGLQRDSDNDSDKHPERVVRSGVGGQEVGGHPTVNDYPRPIPTSRKIQVLAIKEQTSSTPFCMRWPEMRLRRYDRKPAPGRSHAQECEPFRHGVQHLGRRRRRARNGHRHRARFEPAEYLTLSATGRSSPIAFLRGNYFDSASSFVVARSTWWECVVWSLDS